MREEKKPIRKPEDVDGKCTHCDSELEERKGKGYCVCNKCRVVYTYILVN
jgi:hypothetical protein